jgi:hypothetical protein
MHITPYLVVLFAATASAQFCVRETTVQGNIAASSLNTSGIWYTQSAIRAFQRTINKSVLGTEVNTPSWAVNYAFAFEGSDCRFDYRMDQSSKVVVHRQESSTLIREYVFTGIHSSIGINPTDNVKMTVTYFTVNPTTGVRTAMSIYWKITYITSIRSYDIQAYSGTTPVTFQSGKVVYPY